MRLPSIAGDEIVPVRLIPFITADKFGQETLAGILAHKKRANGFPLTSTYMDVVVYGGFRQVDTSMLVDDRPRHPHVYAFHLNEAGESVMMIATEWDRIYFRLSTLESKFRKQEEDGVHNEKFYDWYVEALKILPAGVFLRKSDFEDLWNLYLCETSPLPGGRPDERIINYDAFVDPGCRRLIYEGFEHLMLSVERIDESENLEQPPQQKPNPKAEESLLKMVIGMAISGYKFDPHEKKSSIPAEIVTDLERLGLSITDDTVRKWLRKASSLLPRNGG